MNEVTELALKEWARRVTAATLKILPPSSNNNPRSRREAATEASLKGISRKQVAVDELLTYLEYAESILSKEFD